MGIYIHQLKDRFGSSSSKGSNSFGPIFTKFGDDKKYFYERFETYDWVDNDGYNNLGRWVEDAAKKAGK